MPKVVENINKPTLGLFENMPSDREFEKLKEITKHVVDNVRDIAEIADSNDCSTTSKASVTHKAGAEAVEISLSERLKRAGPPEVAGKLS